MRVPYLCSGSLLSSPPIWSPDQPQPPSSCCYASGDIHVQEVDRGCSSRNMSTVSWTMPLHQSNSDGSAKHSRSSVPQQQRKHHIMTCSFDGNPLECSEWWLEFQVAPVDENISWDHLEFYYGGFSTCLARWSALSYAVMTLAEGFLICPSRRGFLYL